MLQLCMCRSRAYSPGVTQATLCAMGHRREKASDTRQRPITCKVAGLLPGSVKPHQLAHLVHRAAPRRLALGVDHLLVEAAAAVAACARRTLQQIAARVLMPGLWA
jgi:hypothetical protein